MKNAPLSEKLRPQSLNDVFGQEHLLGPHGLLTRIMQGGKPLSLLLWGPPGCGKTTLAKLYVKAFDCEFIPFSAVFQGIADFKKVIKEGDSHPLFHKQKILFVDEIHRFNKAQQDAFLPFIEDGSVVLIGATTENPSFVLNNALLSRLRVLNLNYLDAQALQKIVDRYENQVRKLPLTDAAKEELIHLSQGDGRHLLNLIENLESLPSEEFLDVQQLAPYLQRRPALYDRHQEGHHNLISALHKSVRGSDPQAALYWLARMLEGGEDRQFIARRLVRMASEDIGLADPQALSLTISAWQAFDQLGSPEGELALAEAVVYLALAPKSNAIYTAFKEVQQLAKETTHFNPPAHILNAPTKFMKEIGYSKGYQYDHDTEHGFSGQNYLPPEILRQEFYQPVERGFERELKKRLNYFNRLREKLQHNH